MEKEKQKQVLINVAKLFEKNHDAIIQNWINILYQRKYIDSEIELEYFNNAFKQVIDDFILYLSQGLVDKYYEANKKVAEKVAYNDISFVKFINVFHLFEDSYINILVKSFTNKDDLIYALEAIDRLHHKTISHFAETYFNIHDDTLFAIAKLSTIKDIETVDHLERTREFAGILAETLELPHDVTTNLRRIAPLHDIGKLGLPDDVLQKPYDELDDEEKRTYEKHTAMGEAFLNDIVGQRSVERGSLKMARDVILFHHENYDGSGYPHKTAGEEIPLAARIFHLADFYDLITSKAHKKALTHEEAKKTIEELSNKYFDPKVVEAFLTVHLKLEEISRKKSTST